MSWMSVKKATEIRAALYAQTRMADRVMYEANPYNDTEARVTLVVRDGGNTVTREAEEDSTASAMIADALRELSRRTKETRRRIRAERAPS